MHPDPFRQSPADWQADPRKTFDAWLATRHFRGSSADVYRAQFHHFLDWLAARGKHLLNTEPALIDEFVATLDVKRQQRARYLRIMERVFDDMFQQSRAPGNPARPVARSIDAAWADTRSNAPTGFLNAQQREQLWQVLGRATDPQSGLRWRDVRDCALAAVLLGSGLKLGEADALRLSDLMTSSGNTESGITDEPPFAEGRTMTIPAADPRFKRTVLLPALSAQIVDAWLAIRAEQDIAGELVFPAGRGGGLMHKATVLRAIDSLVEAAGLLPKPAGGKMPVAAGQDAPPTKPVRHDRISPQTLRNAYAATLFEANESDELVAEKLGFAKTISSRRLHTAWQAWLQAKAHQAAVQTALAASANPPS